MIMHYWYQVGCSAQWTSPEYLFFFKKKRKEWNKEKTEQKLSARVDLATLEWIFLALRILHVVPFLGGGRQVRAEVARLLATRGGGGGGGGVTTSTTTTTTPLNEQSPLFDVVAIQFALHYSCGTEATITRVRST